MGQSGSSIRHRCRKGTGEKTEEWSPMQIHRLPSSQVFCRNRWPPKAIQSNDTIIQCECVIQKSWHTVGKKRALFRLFKHHFTLTKITLIGSWSGYNGAVVLWYYRVKVLVSHASLWYELAYHILFMPCLLSVLLLGVKWQHKCTGGYIRTFLIKAC